MSTDPQPHGSLGEEPVIIKDTVAQPKVLPPNTLSKLPDEWVKEILSSSSFRIFTEASVLTPQSQGFFAGDSLITCGRNLGFLNDDKFMNSFERACARFENESLRHILPQLIWRKHVLASCAVNCLSLDGDFVECGTEYGFGVDVVSDYTDFKSTSKSWWLYDTFAGVPAMQMDKGTAPNPTVIAADQFEIVKKKFSDQPRFRILKGMVPESFIQGTPSKIAYLHIDMNNAFAELSALKELLDRVVIGGHVILDDYGWVAFARQHMSENLFFRELGFRVMELATGQGLFVKTTETNAASVNIDNILQKANDMSVACHSYPKPLRYTQHESV
ncbi:MAG: TylF/MycF family methyltransferase [Pirellula sp.]|nr:TylF/MycF family methyltransferase [Pirellula sp.]